MVTTETGDGAISETTDTTGGTETSPPQMMAPSPYRPSALDRAWDAGCGLTMMFFGGILVWRAIRPGEYAEWQSR